MSLVVEQLVLRSMDNPRKKYVNIDKLSSGEIYALLDSIDSADEGEVDSLMNDSDTEFVLEDEVVETDELDLPQRGTSVLTSEVTVHEVRPSKDQQGSSEISS